MEKGKLTVKYPFEDKKVNISFNCDIDEKNETVKDWFNRLHSSTQLVIVLQMVNGFVGSDTLEEALKHNPEVFPDIIERRKIWDTIPQKEKDAYFEELHKLNNGYYDSAPHSGMGIVWYVRHPKEDKERDKWLSAHREKYEKKCSELREKYFGKYGLKE